jgi:hypothetical protein
MTVDKTSYDTADYWRMNWNANIIVITQAITVNIMNNVITTQTQTKIT